MKLLQFSLNNSLYQGLFAISEVIQMIMLGKLEFYPVLFLIFFDSFSLLYLVLLEDISLAINKNPIIIRTSSLNNIGLGLKKNKITKIRAFNKTTKQKTIIISIITLGLLAAINSGLISIVYQSLLSEVNGAFCFFDIILTWFILHLWIREKMYKHHVLALGILFITLCASFGLNLSTITLFVEYFGYSYVSLFTFFFGIVIVQSFRELLEKYMLDVVKMNQFRLLFYEGVVLFTISIFLFGLLQLFNCSEDYEYDSFGFNEFCVKAQYQVFTSHVYELFSYQSIDTLFAYLYILSQCSCQAFRVLINKKLGPTHRYSADQTAFALFMTYDTLNNILTDSFQSFEWYHFLITLLLFIGSLIYNENIIIHLCNLSFNTRAGIDLRANREIVIDESLLERLGFDQDDDVELSSSNAKDENTSEEKNSTNKINSISK